MSWVPTADQSRFIKRYAGALASGDVAIFAGAGLSRSAGYVDWRALLREIASDLKLDIDRETDLIAIAQYHLNEKRNRGRLNQTIVDELARSAKATRCHGILARLPIPTAWTTNYDQVLERSFEDAGKIVDLKLTEANLATTRRGRDVVLYKMHGCVTQPQDAVVTKDDYEQYARRRSLFVESLKGDLISKTFLFLGFSFTDPNIDYILSRVRVLLGTNVREHFCIVRSPQRPADWWVGRTPTTNMNAVGSHSDMLTSCGLNGSSLVEDFAHVTSLLEALSSFVHRKSVFISGAAHDPDPFGRDRLDGFAREVGARLIRGGYNMVSGFGLGLGEQSVIGALRALYEIPKGEDLERLFVRPFPKTAMADQKSQNTRHREELIARSGVVVVIAGNRIRGGGTEMSPGVLEEVEIACREGKRVIPNWSNRPRCSEGMGRGSGEPRSLSPRHQGG